MTARLEEVATNRDHDWRSRFLLGQALLERGEVERAREMLAKAHALRPNKNAIKTVLDLATTEPTASDLILHDLHRSDLYHHTLYFPDERDAPPVVPDPNDFMELLESYGVHVDSITGLAFSSDGQRLLSSSADSTLRLWNVESGACLQIFHSPPVEDTEIVCIHDISPAEAHRSIVWHTNAALDVAIATVDRSMCLIAGFANGDLIIWDANRPDQRRHIEKAHAGAILNIVVAPDGRILATCDSDGNVKLWDIADARPLKEFPGTDERLNGLYINADATRLMTCDWEGEFTVWDIATGERLHRRSTEYYDLVSSGDGMVLMAVDDDKGIVDLDVESGIELRSSSIITRLGIKIILDHTAAIAIHDSPSGFGMFDLEHRRCLRRFRLHDNYLTKIAINPDGSLAISSDRGGRMVFSRLQRPSFVASFSTSHIWTASDLMQKSSTALQIFREIDETLVRGAWQEGLNAVLSLRQQSGFERAPEAIVRHRQLARQGRKSTLREIWPVAEFPPGWDYLGDKHQKALSVVFQYEGQSRSDTESWISNTVRQIQAYWVDGAAGEMFLYATSTSLRRALWNQYTEQGQVVFKLTDLADEPNEIPLWGGRTDFSKAHFSVDGRWLVTVLDEYKFQVWDALTGRFVVDFDSSKHGTTITLHGTRYGFSMANDVETRILSIPDAEEVQVLNGYYGGIFCCAENIDGSVLATGSYDNTVHLWDVSTGRLIRQWNGMGDHPYNDSITGVGLSGDGSLVAFNDDIAGVLIYETETGQLLGRLRPRSESMYWPQTLRYSPDNTWLVVGYGGGDSYIWYLDWDIEIPEPVDWDEGARPFLNAFLQRHQPYAGELPVDREPNEEEIRLALAKRGTPVWDETEFDGLIEDLRDAGFGWLRPNSVRSELERMAEQYSSHPED